MSHTEKDLAGDSQDEDSGHDSADSLAAPLVEDRERIVHLETAVAWIKEEMVSSGLLHGKRAYLLFTVRTVRRAISYLRRIGTVH